MIGEFAPFLTRVDATVFFQVTLIRVFVRQFPQQREDQVA
jgi:hypothetical protein